MKELNFRQITDLYLPFISHI